MVDFSKPVRFKEESDNPQRTITRVVTDLIGRPDRVIVLFTSSCDNHSKEYFMECSPDILENIPEKKYVASVRYRMRNGNSWDTHIGLSDYIYSSEEEVKDRVEKRRRTYEHVAEYRIVSITEFEP